MVAEHLFDLFALAHPQQSVIDEYASQLFANRLVDQNRCDRRIDPARKPADHLTVTHLRADLVDLGLAEFGHRPVARQPADLAHEIGDQLGPIGGVGDFGVELGAVKLASFVCDHRKRGAIGNGDDFEAGGEAGYLVAVAHPHLMAFAYLPQPVKQRAVFGHG